MGDEGKEGKVYENVKISLIGGSAVGKTCIIRRYSNDTFVENPPSTTGGSYSEKFVTIDNKDIQLNLWDTAGQEKFRAIGKHFYKDAYIIIMVYDISKKDTFEEIKEIWYPDVKQNGEKYGVLAVVGNKSDLYEEEEVSENEAKEFAKEIGAFFMLVSAKTGNNVNQLFEALLRQYLGKEFTKKVEEMKKNKGDTKQLKIDKNKDKKKKGCC
jgi:small GTP-binding protein